MISSILATSAVHESNSVTVFKIALKHFCFFSSLLKAERTCQSGFTKCQSTNICIPRTYLCDGDNDCGDMSDESPTHCGKLRELTVFDFHH